MASDKKFYKRPNFITLIIALLIAAVAVPTTLALTARQAKKLDVQIEGEAGGTIQGQIIGLDGRPVKDARILLGGISPRNFGGGPPVSKIRTDENGQFTIINIDKRATHLLVWTPRLDVWQAPLPKSGHKLQINLPEPATLTIRYDIEGADNEGKYRLQLETGKMEGWKGLDTCVRNMNVLNKGEITLTGLTPGLYDLARTKMLRGHGLNKGVFCDRKLGFALDSGITTVVDFIRKEGCPITGYLTGLPDSRLKGAFVYVKSAEATGDPRKFFDAEWKLTTFDAVVTDGKGNFTTAMVSPGAYTVVAESYEENNYNMGIQLPDFVGTAKVIVPEKGEVSPVEIKMKSYDYSKEKKKPIEKTDVQVEVEGAWGEAVEGVQCRLRAEKAIWQTGEWPRFRADLRNNGERKLTLKRRPGTCRLIELDGMWYRPTLDYLGHTVRLSLLPRQQQTDISLLMRGDRYKWQSKEENKPLAFKPGKHTVRVALRLYSADKGQSVSVVSNPVEITIERALPGSGLSIDEAIKEKAAFAAVCEAVEENVPVLSRTVPGVSPISQEFKVVEVLFGKAEAVDRVKLDYKYIYKEPECERAIRKHERVIWIGHTRHMSFHGSLYGLKALPDTPENRQAVKAAASQAATAWGEEVNGLRAAVEFVPEKESYEQGEVVGIRFHLQNVSNQIIHLATPRWWIRSRCFVEDQLGMKMLTRTVPEPWGMTTIDRHKLLPGQAIKLESGSLAIAKDETQSNSFYKYPVRNVVTLKPGQYSLYYWLRFPGITRQDGDGKVIVPQPDDWQGALETGKRKLVLTSTVESDQKSTMQVEGEEGYGEAVEDSKTSQTRAVEPGAKSDGKQDAALQKFIRQYSKQKIVCLDIGEQYTFRSHNGIEKLIRLVSVKDYRDTVIRRVRRAEVVVEVNGKTVRLVCEPYTMPTVIDGLRIQADTTSGWGNIAKRVQLSIWDANDPIVDTRKFCFPIKRYLLFSHGMQAYNEVLHLGLRDGDPKGHTGYHDYGIDLGGYDGGEEVVSCCSGQVVSLWPKSGMPSAVSVQDQGGLIWLHAHLNSVAANIVEGVKVSAGQKIGVLGKKGHSGNFSHLHLGTSLTRADLTANRFCRRLNLYPWIVTAFQEKYGRNLYAVARPHQVVLTGEEVIFDGSKSLAYDAKIVGYRWEFENGQVVRAVKAGKVFNKPGVYVGTLRVRDEQGNEDVDFCRVKVFARDAPEDNIAATIYMTHTPTLGISEGQEVLFQFWIQGSRKERISIDFGDGATLSDYVSYQEVRHKFDRQGIYIITATANVNGRPIMGKQRVGVESTAGR